MTAEVRGTIREHSSRPCLAVIPLTVGTRHRVGRASRPVDRGLRGRCTRPVAGRSLFKPNFNRSRRRDRRKSGDHLVAPSRAMTTGKNCSATAACCQSRKVEPARRRTAVRTIGGCDKRCKCPLTKRASIGFASVSVLVELIARTASPSGRRNVATGRQTR